MRLFYTILAALLLALPARADVPVVVADIAPIQSLVARVMDGLGVPQLIVDAGASPHGYAMRPSTARALRQADLVVWVGPGLTPWLSKPIETLAIDATRLELLALSDTHLLAFRDPDAGHEAEHEHDHDHDSQTGMDPHAWLDPVNGQTWLVQIAEQLAGIDPENAMLYRANARAGAKELTILQADLATQLEPMQGQPYVTFHDAYQYFETRFGLTPTGSVTASDATSPGPAGLAHLREDLDLASVRCGFSEPQFDTGLLHAAGGGDLKIIALDPMGSGLPAGPGLYPDLLRAMAQAFASCTNQD